MSNSKITLHGSVPLDIGGKELLSLTGSAIVLEIGGLKVLTDIGLFQGGAGAEAFNKTNVNFLSEIDAVIITHPHIDHIGRLPLLYKHGFRGPIYMTPEARKITIEMLKDSLKVDKGEKIERVRRNNKLGFRLKQAIRIKQSLIELQKNNFSDPLEKQSVQGFLNKKLGNSYNDKEAFEEVSAYLDFHEVKTENDIGKVIAKLKETLYTEEEMMGAIGLIQSTEYGEEKIISNKEINIKNKNNENQELLIDLPEKIAKDGYNESITVSSIEEKRKLRSIWDKKLTKEIEKIYSDKPDYIENKKNKLEKELKTAFTYCNEQYSFLKNKNSTNTDNNLSDFKFTKEYELIRIHFNRNNKLLKKYKINSVADIDRLVNDKNKLIKILKERTKSSEFDISFSLKDINKACHLVKIRKKQKNLRHVTGFTLTEAAHVVGSASINIISGVVKGNVNDILDIKGDAISVFLSGDLGRMEDNRLGQPEIPAFPMDHLQLESTYADKEHRNRAESVKDLVDSIEQSKGSVLISVFAQHRLQEILITLLEEKKKNPSILDNEILIDAPLGEKLTNLYIEYKGEIFDLLTDEAQEEIFGKVVFRFLGDKEWLDLYEGIDSDGNIINKKYIILASSGMMEGGAIMNHIPMIVDDPDATILAPGYLCKGTLGHEIVIEGKDTITVNGNKLDVECNKKFIDGFSSHISHSEILAYLSLVLKNKKLKLDSTISLNHGIRKGQEILKKDIEALLKQYDRSDVKVIIPEMFDEYDIETRKTKKASKAELEVLVVDSSKQKGVTPKFLMGEKFESDYRKVVESKELIEQRKNNENKIINIRKYSEKNIGSILADKTKLVKKFLINKLSGFKNNKLYKFLGTVSKLGESQDKRFNDLIDRKLKTNKAIKSNISNLSNRIKNINIIYDLIVKFSNYLEYSYQGDIASSEDDIRCRLHEIYNIKLELEQISKNALLDSDTKKQLTESCKNIINSKKRKVKYQKTKISKLMKKVNTKIDHFETRLQANILKEYHSQLSNILSEMWEGNNEESLFELRELCDEGITDIKLRITVQKGELESGIKIKLKPRKPVFKGKNLYKEIFSFKNGNLDLEKLKILLDDNLFSEIDKKYIEKCLEDYNSGKKDIKTKGFKRLKKFFKNKQKINNDLGIALEVNGEDLYNEALIILKEIFRGDYFEEQILPNFNIYLFLKSEEPFYKYIKRKYNLEKLKGYKKSFSEIEKTIKEFNDYKENLDIVSENNYDATNIESIEQVGDGIKKMIGVIRNQITQITGSGKKGDKENKKDNWSYKNEKNKGNSDK